MKTRTPIQSPQLGHFPMSVSFRLPDHSRLFIPKMTVNQIGDAAMYQPLTREQVRDVDRRAVEEFAMPSILLMENAGRGAVEILEAQGIRGPIVICAGKGNNGGDGFVMARHLENRRHMVCVLLFCDPEKLQGDAAVNFKILKAAKTPVEILATEVDAQNLADRFHGADWIVDALLGTGTQGVIREPFITAIQAINESPANVFSVDLPSGMDCNTGQSLGNCVRANVTATFVARKIGFDAPNASNLTGVVHVVDIGVPRRAFEI
jgi:NAD(P)H-hydrate epimerase